MKPRKSQLWILLLSCLLFSVNPAVAQLGLMGVGGKLALVDPEQVGTTFGLGAFADLGLLTPDIQLEGGIDYWSKTVRATSYYTTADARIRDLTFSATAKYQLAPVGVELRPYLGGGLALHFLNAEGRLNGLTVVSGSDSRLGIDLCGGVFYKVSPVFDLLGAMRYRLVRDWNHFEIRTGLLYRLWQ
jgi:hypothetical protein